jgi:hypothetical protein
VPIVASVSGGARSIEVGEGEGSLSPEKKEDKMMPNFILATAALVLRHPFPPPAAAGSHEDAVHEAMHARTRTREATRRLRASRIHEPYVDLGWLDLSRRH